MANLLGQTLLNRYRVDAFLGRGGMAEVYQTWDAHRSVAAWHNPAAALRCPQVSTFLTAYGNTRAQVAAVVDVLVGASAPTGVLPMTIP
jgi:hypothetical protein